MTTSERAVQSKESSKMKKLDIHPDAALFPMMSDEELNTLAEDIKANGLVHPIVVGKVDGKDVIIDGRNRLKACELAGVEPSFTSIEDRDPKEFILSVNVNRRHMNSGQRHMAVAMIYPDPEKRGRGNKSEKDFAAKSFSSSMLSRARIVLADSRAVAEQVLSGEVFLPDAYEKAKERIRAKQDDDRHKDVLRREAPDILVLVTEGRIKPADGVARLEARKRDHARLSLIRDDSPDLVALVEEGRMSVQDAMAAHDRRHEEERNLRHGATLLLGEVVRLLDVKNVSVSEQVDRLSANFDTNLWPRDTLGEPDPKMFLACADILKACAESLSNRK